MLELELFTVFSLVGFHQLLKEDVVSFVHSLLDLFEESFDYGSDSDEAIVACVLLEEVVEVLLSLKVTTKQ